MTDVIEHQFDIEGMTCGSCAARIQLGFEQASAIDVGTVNYAMKTGYVKGELTKEQVKTLVFDLGYEAIFLSKKLSAEEIEEKETKDLAWRKKSLIFSGVLSLPVFLLGMGFVSVKGGGYIQLILTSIVMFGPGINFYQVAWRLLRKKSANMDSLVAMGTLAAWFYSIYLLMIGASGLYFESAAVIIALVLVGKYLEENAKQSAAEAIRSLSKLQPKTAVKLIDGKVEAIIPIADLLIDDLVLVRAGEKVPTDGVLYEGETDLDESLISGESLPVSKKKGDQVTGGTINVGSRPIKIKVSQVGGKTLLAQIIKLVEDAQSSKPKIQNLADKISLYFVPAALIISLATFLIWFFVLDADFAKSLIPAVSVLVIACPCALGLATPAAIVAATGRAAELHILVRSALALEKAESITKVIFDKTGTLTIGKPKVVRAVFSDTRESSTSGQPLTDLDIYSVASSLEANSQHPLAVGITEYCKEKNSQKIDLDDFEEFSGEGLKAITSLGECIIGKKEFLTKNNIEIPNSWESHEKENFGLVYLSINRKPAALFTLEDPIRDSAINAARRLESLGIELVLATGDRLAVAASVANKVGIKTVEAELMPKDKLGLIEKYRSSDQVVAMVGDGINDAPALAAADVGIALGSGTDVALSAASLVLPKGDLSRVAESILLSKETIKIIRQNLFWAFLYNTVSIPLAAIGLLSPMVASGAMAFSSVSVVLNSLRLRKFSAKFD